MNFKQRKILKLLNDYPGKKYSELYKFFEEEDKFPYHLKYLLNHDLVRKDKDLYYVTHKGSAMAVNWIDTEFNELVHKVPRIIFICKFQDKFLIKKYYKNVFLENQFYGLPGIKVPFGQKDLHDLIHQKLKTKYKIIGNTQFKGIQNLLFENKTGEIIFDFIYLIFNVEVYQLLGEVDGFAWFTKEEVRNLPPISSVLDDFILTDNYEPFSERIFKV